MIGGGGGSHEGLISTLCVFLILFCTFSHKNELCPSSGFALEQAVQSPFVACPAAETGALCKEAPKCRLYTLSRNWREIPPPLAPAFACSFSVLEINSMFDDFSFQLLTELFPCRKINLN